MDKKAIGEKLRGARKFRKLSQKELAHESGVAYATIQAMESGEGNPTIDSLLNVFQTLNLELSEFFEGPKSKAAKQAQAKIGFQESAKVLEALSTAGLVRRATVLYLLLQEDKYFEPLPPRLRRVFLSVVKDIE